MLNTRELIFTYLGPSTDHSLLGTPLHGNCKVLLTEDSEREDPAHPCHQDLGSVQVA